MAATVDAQAGEDEGGDFVGEEDGEGVVQHGVAAAGPDVYERVVEVVGWHCLCEHMLLVVAGVVKKGKARGIRIVALTYDHK